MKSWRNIRSDELRDLKKDYEMKHLIFDRYESICLYFFNKTNTGLKNFYFEINPKFY